MSKDYHKLQKEGNSNSKVLSMSDLIKVFCQNLNQWCNNGRDVVKIYLTSSQAL